MTAEVVSRLKGPSNHQTKLQNIRLAARERLAQYKPPTHSLVLNCSPHLLLSPDSSLILALSLPKGSSFSCVALFPNLCSHHMLLFTLPSSRSYFLQGPECLYLASLPWNSFSSEDRASTRLFRHWRGEQINGILSVLPRVTCFICSKAGM